MPTRYQAVALAGALSHANAVVWSEENLLAVASGHLVSIINPSLPCGPRGTINIASSEPYTVGHVKKGDSLCFTLLSTVSSRDRRPCVRSISWSALGMATNSGCLIAMCTTEGRVKIYRPPYCDYSAEWIEVIDVSDHLYCYLLDANFGEAPTKEIQESRNISNLSVKPCVTRTLKRKQKESTVISCVMETNPILIEETKAKKIAQGAVSIKYPESSILSLISADQCASRRAMLSQLVVAWSPIITSSNSDHSNTKIELPIRFSILAVGGKSGNIYVWKISAPQWYSLEDNSVPSIALAQLLKAHKSWVNTLSFALIQSRTIMASGSSDGSVIIWVWNNGCFSIFKEVLPPNYAPVSVVSLFVGGSPRKMMLGVGKYSGFLEVHVFDETGASLSTISSFKAHDFVITSLAWSSGYLYTCAQDNYIRGWTLHNETLKEFPLPELTPNIKCCAELPDAFISCQGLAVSPTNLTLAAIRNLDAEQLNPMYQAGVQRSILELIWIVGEESNLPTGGNHEVFNWQHDIVSSLNELENSGNPIVLWDLILALSSFEPPVVDKIISSWLLPGRPDLPLNDTLVAAYRSFPTFSTRKLNVINIICRRLYLSELTVDDIGGEVDFDKIVVYKGERFAIWLNLLLGSEKELRERVVRVAFSNFLTNSAVNTNGIPQILEWVAAHGDRISIQVKELAIQVAAKCGENYGKEKCGYCAAPVPFDSPEVAYCEGSEFVNGAVESHKLLRCGATMQLCGNEALWVCKCCCRSVKNLAPSAELPAQPLCPFCGILLQVWQPPFLPSVTAV